MNKTYIFPILIILIDIGSAIMYGINHDWRKVLYWGAAAVLNIALTF